MSKQNIVTVIVGDVLPGEDAEEMGMGLAEILHVVSLSMGVRADCSFSVEHDRIDFYHTLREFDCPNIEGSLLLWDRKAHPVAAVHVVEAIDVRLN